MKPWRKLGERVVYDRFRRLRGRTFELPDGEVADFEVLDLNDSVAVLALTPEREVILVGEFRAGPEEVLVGLPGGIVEPGRSAVEAARAELLEETGYEGELQVVGTLFKDAYATGTKHVVVATGCRRVGEPEHPELTEPTVLSLDEFREHLRGGRLTDTDAAYRALEFLGLL